MCIQPVISIIMSVYNTRKVWLEESINSILNQTLDNFEFIIVLDCPTDGCESIVYKYAEIDRRIVVIVNDTNLGLSASLNKAIKIARGKYIARMDSDDISVADRLSVQYQYMEQHMDVIAVGSFIETFGASHMVEDREICDQERFKIQMLFRNVGLAHPTAFIRREAFKNHGICYDVAMRKAQDYRLWVDLMWLGHLAVIPQVLLKYRIHEAQISFDTIMCKEGINAHVEGSQLFYADKVSIWQAEKLVGELSPNEKAFHLTAYESILPYDDCSSFDEYLQRLKKKNEEKGMYNKKKFHDEISYIWCHKALKRYQKYKKYDMLMPKYFCKYLSVYFFKELRKELCALLKRRLRS